MKREVVRPVTYALTPRQIAWLRERATAEQRSASNLLRRLLDEAARRRDPAQEAVS